MSTPHKMPPPVPLPQDLRGTNIGRFAIRTKLGAGGMGEVYYAEDAKLLRPVALKRLSTAAADNPAAPRKILEEARRASLVSSEHIARIYDVVEQGGELLIVMEYVEGETLRQRLCRPMNQAEFLEIATQCAEALVEAHHKGLIHRDIKPENIMITPSGHVKILDFGLAHMLRSSGPEASTITVGVEGSRFAGTPGYTAPEVLRLEDADTNADIFSLGVVFYEMLAGVAPFAGSSAVLICDRILHDEPVPLHKVAPQCPAELNRVVMRMLSKKASDRYSAPGLAAVLKAVKAGTAVAPRPMHTVALIAALLVVGAAALYFLVRTRGNVPERFAARDWVLISDFDNAGGNPIFDRTLREALTISLQQSAWINVVPRDRVFSALRRMQRAEVDHVDESLGREICQRENVKVLLTGSIVASGEAFQISVRALEPNSGAPLFVEEERFQHQEELFDRVDRITGKVRRHLGESLRRIESSSQSLASVTTRSLEALQLYSRAVDDIALGRMQSAQSRLQAALTLDADFAMAHYRLAMVHRTLGQRKTEIEEIEHAYQLSQRVSERERYVLQAAHFDAQGHIDRATELLEILVNLYPDDADAYYELALAYDSLRKPQVAIADLQQVLRLKPYSAEGYAALMS